MPRRPELQQETYANLRCKMKPGDIIAFGGESFISSTIKHATNSNVSHVGVVLQARLLIDGNPQSGFFNQVVESSYEGVRFTRLSGIAKAYDGELWWLPLSAASRKKLNVQEFFNFLLHHEGRPYDLRQAIKAGVDPAHDLFRLTRNQENFEKLFCSELVAGALEAGGLLDKINASEVTPIDLCRLNIYAEHYVQFKGQEKSINWFNSVPPSRWAP